MGLEEATLGHFLHFFPGIGAFLVSARLRLYERGQAQHRKNRSVLFTALVAASIKLSDLFLTAQIVKVINPAAAIVLEGLSVYAICRILEKGGTFALYSGIGFIRNLLQELLFMAYIAVLPFFTPFKAVRFNGLYDLYCPRSRQRGFIFLFIRLWTIVSGKSKPDFFSFQDNRTFCFVRAASPLSLTAVTIFVSLVI